VKGIAHFISGIAVASLLPDAVHQAADGSLVIALGGLFGLLPDTLDFRFGRYLERYDDEIDPDPHNLQPQAIAERVAAAMRDAFQSDQPRTVMLHTARIGPDLWRRYDLRFAPGAGAIVVRAGPAVTTAGAPLPGSARPAQPPGRASIGVPIVHTYDDVITIDAFSGPAFRFERRGDTLHVTFLPWHRRWSHSLPLAAALGLLVGVLLGPTAGWVSGLAFATHVLEDQLGYMGSNLLWPFTRRRWHGMGLLHSGDALPNFATVWAALALTLFNLDRFSSTPRLPAVPTLLAVVILPTLLMGALYWRQRRRATPAPAEALRQADILAEVQDPEP
jgi:membrane-bound metal-dependent hydrolase YbcI (DUF457 family)